MRLFHKIFLIIVAVFFLSVTGLGFFAWLRHDQLTSALIEKINETINTKISYGTLKVTIFESFPSITVRMNNLLIAPSQGYDRSQFTGENNDTLLYASSFSLAADLPSLLTGTIAVRSITAKDGELNLFTDDKGNINYKVFSSEEKEGGKNVKLNSITARSIRTVWSDKGSELRIEGDIKESTLSGEIFRTGIYLNASLTASLSALETYGMNFSDIPAEAVIRLRKTDNSLSVTRGSLELAGLSFGIGGTVNYSTNSLDMVITGKKINISDLVARLPEKWRSVTGGLNPEGLIDLTCVLNGPYGDKGSPHFEIIYNLSHGKLNYQVTGLDVNNLAFRGRVTNGRLNRPESFVFTVDTLTTTFGSAYFTGSFRLRNLEEPEVHLSLNGDLIFEDLRKIIKADFLNRQEGSIKGSLKLSGTLPDNMKISLADLPALHPDASVIFKDFGATMAANGLTFSEVNGAVLIRDHLTTDNLSFSVLGQHFLVSAEMRNFIAWLAGKTSTMDVTGDISADRFIPALFTGTESDSINEDEDRLNIFPRDITMNVMLRADSIFSKGFRARNFHSTLTYKPYIMTFSDISAEGLDGTLTGEILIGKQNNGSYISRAKLEVTDIDINDAFSSFNNFGQEFIVSNNLQGRLTGNVTILTPLDSNFDIITKALVAEARLLITDGRLIDFGPAESLSSFVDLDELKDIGFSKLENDLFIRNSMVSIPKMLINSSVGNLIVYGSHNFNGDYSYHVRVLLSEVLSHKARDRNRNDAEFGQVKVDGLGKATIPLKIVCENGVTSVGYDFGQAQDEIKESIAEEKQTLKGILNEEYGWYKGDTIKKTVQKSKPRFTITWEEGKEQATETEVAQQPDKQNPLKQLLKKKK